MARPPKLPGIWGALAASLGVSGLSKTLGTNPRTLNNWAHNKTPMPAIEAGLLADLCKEHAVEPQLFTHPNIANGYVANTPEGWVMWTWGAPPNGYAKRHRYMGHLECLVPANKEVWVMAKLHGWPYAWPH